MSQNDGAQSPPRIEPRWPVMLTILGVVAVLSLLPARIRVTPWWGHYAAGAVMLASLVPGRIASDRRRWLRVEHVLMIVFVVLVALSNILTLGRVVQRLVHPTSELGGLQLLASGIAVWINNVFTFSILYWQTDRGGPEARLNGSRRLADWLFSQEGVPEHVRPGWTPAFIDYLFLAFTAATAFSPTDVLPLTGRAKALLIAESMTSLLTLVVVASRAINILGS